MVTDDRVPASSLEARIRIGGDALASIVPPRIAALLERAAGMTADRRARLRHTDPEAYVALSALHLAALRSDSGTKAAVPQQNSADLTTWKSSAEAAETLGVTDRCIRKWCSTGQLRAVISGHRWLIDPNSTAPTKRGEPT
ncbi:helix-turn-helix domain-containing protein [Mycobacterium sp. BMJ-28]